MITSILVFGGFFIGTVGSKVTGRKGGSVIMTAGLTLFAAKQ